MCGFGSLVVVDRMIPRPDSVDRSGVDQMMQSRDFVALGVVDQMSWDFGLPRDHGKQQRLDQCLPQLLAVEEFSPDA